MVWPIALVLHRVDVANIEWLTITFFMYLLLRFQPHRGFGWLRLPSDTGVALKMLHITRMATGEASVEVVRDNRCLMLFSLSYLAQHVRLLYPHRLYLTEDLEVSPDSISGITALKHQKGPEVILHPVLFNTQQTTPVVEAVRSVIASLHPVHQVCDVRQSLLHRSLADIEYVAL